MKKTFALCGFMAAGKSSLAKNIAQHFKFNPKILVSDLDLLVEQDSKLPIKEIFNSAGEARFRELEAISLEKWLQATNGERYYDWAVIALGGGALESNSVQALLLQNDVTIIWINTPWEICLSRILVSKTDRPKSNISIEQLKQLYEKRKLMYQLSAVSLDGSLSEGEILEQFIGVLTKYLSN